MMETLEQQQTKSTSNIDPRAGSTETTPAASEEDDFDNHNNAFGSEKKEKNNSPHYEMTKNNIPEKNIQNGRSKQETSGSPHRGSISDTSSTSNSLDGCLETPDTSSVKLECKHDTENEAMVDSNPSVSQNVKPSIDIKIEEEGSLSSLNIDDDGVKMLSACATETKDNNYVPKSSPAIKENERSSPNEQERCEINLSSSETIKIEEQSSSASIKTEGESAPSPVYKVNEDDSPETSSPTLRIASEKTEEETIAPPLIGYSEDQPFSKNKDPNEVKIEEHCLLDSENKGSDETSSPVYKVDEPDNSSQATTSKDNDLSSSAVAVKSVASPVYKINDLSPAIIPDESSDDSNVETYTGGDKPELPSVDTSMAMGFIKIESDTEEEELNEKISALPNKHSNSLLEIKAKQAVEPTLKMKVNGAHSFSILSVSQPVSQQAQQMEPMEIDADVFQLSVIPKTTGLEKDNEHNNSERRSNSRSSSVSSTSPQLVIDHPESEQNTKQPLHTPQEEEKSLHVTKRKRSGSSGSEAEGSTIAKQKRLEEKSSLLLQRLQAPVASSNEIGQLLSCYKCNANNFENFQQLNIHYAHCGELKKATEAANAVANCSTPTLALAPPTSLPIVEAAAATATAVPVQSDPDAMFKKERFFRCARCSTVHQCWNFFLHMREVHRRYICLYCSHVFSSVEKLSLHLENKHDMDQHHFGDVKAWQTLQAQEDRARYLVCCNCQASFERGTQFDDHDCAQLMQPCALCGQKGSHANGCRNGSHRKKTARRKRRSAKNKQSKKDTSKSKQMGSGTDAAMQDLSQTAPYYDDNIPGTSKGAAAHDAQPKLVVPKIMLRVPKEFQKSVDAELSSTDTEDDEIDDEIPTAAESNQMPDMLQQQLLPTARLSEDTETATETASTFLEGAPFSATAPLDLEDNDSSTGNLTRVLAEFERTKLDILRTKAHIRAKREQHQLNVQEHKQIRMEQQQQLEQEQQQQLQELQQRQLQELQQRQLQELQQRQLQELQQRQLQELQQRQLQELQQQQQLQQQQPELQQQQPELQQQQPELQQQQPELQQQQPELQQQQPELQQQQLQEVQQPQLQQQQLQQQQLQQQQLQQQQLQQQQLQQQQLQEVQQQQEEQQQLQLSSVEEPRQDESGDQRKPRRWSPTPPESPHHSHNHITDNTTDVPAEQENTENEMEPTIPVIASVPISQRRDTLGSECMDIDESINEAQQEQLPMVPVPEQLPMVPVSEQLQMDPVPGQLPMVPLSEQLPMLPVPEQLPMLPVPEQLPMVPVQEPTPVTPPPPADAIEVASMDTVSVELQLDQPLDKFEMIDFIRLCTKSVCSTCLYCNHVRRIAVNIKQLVLHLIAKHRYTATVDSITAEELQPETIVNKLKSYLPALEGDHYMNSASYCTWEDGRFVLPFNERLYECFQCRFTTSTHKELYTHNRRLHVKCNISCAMCHLNFFSFTELLCHICPGATANSVYDIQFRCCLCQAAPLASAFRLMVHLRKQHQACDTCLEDCHTQAKLSSHVWKHKLLHLCYRCGIAYRNKQDISKHLFWKHGTESISCKRCQQKRWRHVYHFCVPANQFTCEQCQLTFSKAVFLEVHKREHNGDFRYACHEDYCDEKFVSRKLLLKHAAIHEFVESPCNEENPASGDIENPDEEEARQSRANSEQLEGHKLQSEEVNIEAEQCASPKSKTGDQGDKDKAPQLVVKDKTPPQAEQKQKKKEDDRSPRKRRKKVKRNKASLENLNLIAPNLSESDSSDDSNSDATRSTSGAPETSTHGLFPMRTSVDDLDMPKVMLSPASESDSDEQQVEKKLSTEPATIGDQQLVDAKQSKAENDMDDEDEHNPNLEANTSQEEVPDIWKNLLQHQTVCDKVVTEPKTAETKSVVLKPKVVKEADPKMERPRPQKLHVAVSDHDYCKMYKPPPPPQPPSPKKHAHGTPNKSKRSNDDSDSDSSSSSSSSGSDSSSCSCGSNCSCSSSGSSSSDDDSDNESQSSRNAKKTPKKAAEPQDTNNGDEDVNVTSINDEEPPPVVEPAPMPVAPPHNESDFETGISDTDEEFYDAHPQKLASEQLAEKRIALLAVHTHQTAAEAANNNDIVENSRPSTPSLPEEMAAYAEKRERASKNKKRKRERKSTCKSAAQVKLFPTMPEVVPQILPEMLPQMLPQMIPDMSPEMVAQYISQMMPKAEPHDCRLYYDAPPTLSVSTSTTSLQEHFKQQQQQQQQQLQQQQQQQQQQQLQLLSESPMTQMQRTSWQPRISEGSSCSDADAQLKRSKRTRRPNKFYGYTSDDENMSSVLAPPLQVGMQLIKPQPPPQLTWAKEDLPTPAKPPRSRSNQNDQSHLSPNLNSHLNSNGSARKRPKRPPQSGGSGNSKRSVKRVKKSQAERQHLPPIPTLKIRTGMLPASAAASDSSNCSSDDDEDAVINVTSLPAVVAPVTASPAMPTIAPPVAALPVPLSMSIPAHPPPPATKAFNQPIPPALLPNPDFATLQYFKANNIRYPIRPPAGARLPRDGESVYCYCRCPYDEVSEMIACDGDNCMIEWFHFECVGIMVAPQGKWFCAECRPKFSEGLYLGARAK